ncbi:MAG TPA: signal peptide peptidase SppA [Gemmataceae bacterium]|nr:signal peptide peptidase SppA [Gemmataceae bacterium]
MRRLFLALGIAVVVPLLGVPAAQAAPAKGEKKSGARPIIAVFRLSGSVGESPAEDFSLFGGPKPATLKDLVARLRKAAKDDAVKAVVILSEGGTAGSAQVEELRQAMKQVRDAGKDIYVHADELSMREYVLLSGASRISLVPTGGLWITGLYGEAPYLRGLLNKLGIKPDYLTCGAYKSAAEIFMREGPSPEAEKMQNWLLDSIYDTQVRLIARGRGVDDAKVRAWIDNGPYTARGGQKAGLIDAVEHRQDFETTLKSRFGKDVVFNKSYGQKKPPQLDFSSPFAMFKIWADLLAEGQKKKSSKDAVAIVYVEGPITLGGGGAASLLSGEAAVSSAIRKALDEAARDDSIKAVVLRVNSPGGSAVASEIILDATKRVKARKPFVVSMGDVAGSGGYYVACGSDTIYADAATITGSIGVVSGKFATNDMWKKVGVTFKAYRRGARAGMLSSDNVFTQDERARMQSWMDEIYGVFKSHVVAIRGKRLKKPIDELAGGRVYTGRQALELGLVDKIGSLEDAIHHVAHQAKLSDYDVRVVPRPKGFLEQLLEESAGDKEDSKRLGMAAHRLIAGSQPSLVDLAMPYLKHLDPERVRVIKMALQRLELMQQEGVVLMMPELLISR